MRANVPDYELRVPRDLGEALALLAERPGEWRPFAGGTDLMVLFEAGRLAHRKFVSIWRLAELRGVEETDAHVTLGALTTYADVRASATMQREFPILCRAAAETGGLAIQNRGTLGGNIANASPAADSPPGLIAYGAQVELLSASGARWVEYENFHTGYKQTVMRADELVARVRLPRPAPGATHYWHKVGTRRAQAISKVCLAAYAELEGARVGEVRIALGSVAPVVLRCRRTEDALRGRELDAATIEEAARMLSEEVAPIDDIRSTARYRRKVSENLLREFLAQLSGQGLR
ncbi:MAG TPA: xanthine dehydrogenase family protein subunit M [Pyrinomonadaceae bacterium]|nr:xanthine dehydrogenase family protein subunit M [Pyrinomonadaceae bacterium]